MGTVKGDTRFNIQSYTIHTYGVVIVESQLKFENEDRRKKSSNRFQGVGDRRNATI